MKVFKWLEEHMEESLMIILLVVITCVSMIQVIIRKIPWIPSLTWAEEFCRFCWIWSVFISLPYTIRMGSMLRVGVLLDAMPVKVRNTINILVDLVITASMVILAYYSVRVVSDIRASGETSPAMVWPMWVIYSVMLIGFALAAVRGVQSTAVHIRNFNQKELTTLEQTMKEAAEEAALAQKGGDE